MNWVLDLGLVEWMGKVTGRRSYRAKFGDGELGLDWCGLKWADGEAVGLIRHGMD